MTLNIIRFIQRITTRINMWAYKKIVYIEHYKHRKK